MYHQAERKHLEQWQEKLQEREARVQRVAQALQRQQGSRQRQRRRRALWDHLRRGAAQVRGGTWTGEILTLESSL